MTGDSRMEGDNNIQTARNGKIQKAIIVALNLDT